MLKYVRIIGILALASGSAFSFGQDVVVHLSDGNSTAQLNMGNSASSGPLGVNGWTLGGTPECTQQVFVLGVNGGGVAPLADYVSPSVNQVSSREALITYATSNFLFQTDYILTSISANSTDLSEVVIFTNLSNSSMTYDLGDLNHFSPGGSTGGTGTLTDPNTIQQVKNGTSITAGVTFTPTHWAINTFSSIASALLGGNNLADGSSPYTNASDMGSAFQWRGTVPQGGGFSLTLDQTAVAAPEPASLLALAGFVGFVIRKRRK